MTRRTLTVVGDESGKVDALSVNDKLEILDGLAQNLTDTGLLPYASVIPYVGASGLVDATPSSGGTATKGAASYRALVAADLPADVALLDRSSQVWSGDPQIYTGSVGVGGASFGGGAVPTEKLDVNGALRVRNTTTVVSADSASFDYQSSSASGRVVVFGHTAGTCAGFAIFLRSSDASIARTAFVIDSAGRIGNITTPTSALQITGLPVYANNAAALAGGLTVGAFYRTGADPDPVCVVH